MSDIKCVTFKEAAEHQGVSLETVAINAHKYQKGAANKGTAVLYIRDGELMTHADSMDSATQLAQTKALIDYTDK